MNNDKKISIIIGIYNCADTLDEAIQSIISQTYTNWQMIMCDDGSTDNTYDVAKKYAEQNPEKFVLLKNKKNQGLNITLNKCLSIADGDYIARMDGDDISLPTRLEREVEFLNNNPNFAFVSTAMILFDDNGDWGNFKKLNEFPKKEDLINVPAFCHAPCMVRREAYLAVGGYTVDDRLLRVEDCHLWFKMYANGYKGANLLEPLYKMRDDKEASKRRTLKARKNGIYVMCIGFKLVKMPWYMYFHLVKFIMLEIIKGSLPKSVYDKLHRRNLNLIK